MNRMLEGLNDNTNFALTENMALARASTNSEFLDFFSQGGAVRGKEERGVELFSKAWAEDRLNALRAMFYFRDVRGGQGQREAFRKELAYLERIDPATVRKNLKLIPEYGRWDDLFVLLNTSLHDDVIVLVMRQLMEDSVAMEKGKSISLLAKWMPSENASSKKTRKMGNVFRSALGLTPRKYRKMLSDLRAYLKVVERDASSNNWGNIDYSSVPSNAMLKYRKAFSRNDTDRFVAYLNKVKEGTESINAGTLYPYDLVHKVFAGDTSQTVDLLWDNLPDYVAGSTENSIAVVDVSGSMNGTPKEVAISLGLYLGERAAGPYKDHFITFSKSPRLQKIVGNTFAEKVRNLESAQWDMNTDIEKVFKLILNTAVQNSLRQEEMIDRLYIISDMEFDAASTPDGFRMGYGLDITPSVDKTLMNTIRQKFYDAGYQPPELVFWNVNARNSQFPMSTDDRGFLNVSGFSPSIFKSLMDNKYTSPLQLALEVVNAERYQPIQLAR